MNDQCGPRPTNAGLNSPLLQLGVLCCNSVYRVATRCTALQHVVLRCNVAHCGPTATAKIEADRQLFPGRIAQIVWAPTFFDDKRVCEFALASVRLGFGAEGFQLPLTCANPTATTPAQRTGLRRAGRRSAHA
jgi:hypothetical protein